MIGNPPYVEAKKLKYIASTLKRLFTIYSGTADLSIYFIEQGINLLKENGILSYITTNKFLNTGYGRPVRKLISEHHINQLINFEQVEVFEGILVSSVILNIQNHHKALDNKFVYEQFYKFKTKDFRREFIKRQQSFGSYSQDFLDENEWSFSATFELLIKSKIEKNATILKNIEGVSVYRGVTTGYNPAFIISNKKRDELIAEDIKNADVIKNMLQGRNIRKWYYNESNENLIFVPWHFPLKKTNINGASEHAEDELENNYPSLYRHLSLYKQELSSRNKEETGIRYEWYTLQRCAASYYPEFEKPEKIIWGLTADKWAFAYDSKQHYLPSNGYILTSQNIPIKYLLGLINSKLMHYYFNFIGVMTAGGAYTLKAATIESLPVIIAKNQSPIISLVEKILEIKGSNTQADTSDEEYKIDNFVYQLYDLTDDEIKIVEEKVK